MSSGGAAYLFEEVAFVVFHVATLEELKEFFLVRTVTMMFGLIADVGEELAELPILRAIRP